MLRLLTYDFSKNAGAQTRNVPYTLTHIEFHGKKDEQILYDEVIKITKLKNGDYVWWRVWENNLRQ